MKYKFLIPVFFSVLIGFIFGKILFNQYENTNATFGDGELVYFIQAGIYSDIDSMKKDFEKIDNYLYLNENNAYHLYVGLTKNVKIASKIKDYYKNKGNNIYIKEKYINNPEFTTLLGEYDKIIDISSKESDIEIIQRVVIESYKELLLQEWI